VPGKPGVSYIEREQDMSDDHPRWLFDESSQVGVDYNDTDTVADYDDQHERFRDFEQEARKIVAALGLSEDATVLDIGCGTGGLTIPLARIYRHVYAVDTASAMISVLRGKTKHQGLNNVTAMQSGFLTYKHEGGELDGIIANITLHHLPDFWKQIALCRFYDLLKPGGRLFLNDVVFSFDPRKYREAIDDWIVRMQDIAGYRMAEETVVHVRDEFSTWEWVMTGMLERAGFQIDSHFEFMPHMRAYICSKQQGENDV
jgi:ubiquinone/menaquinone biosynthesis C-methylase UbiE